MDIIILLTAFIISIIINWILINFSSNLGVRNISKIDEIRWQARKPSLGGLSFFLVFLIINSFLADLNPSKDSKELGILISISVGFLIGLIDDAKNTNPLLKLFGQILCGVILVKFGIIINLSENLIWNSIFTIFWVVFLMNSINMLDNMDGLTSLISIFILMGIYFYSDQIVTVNYKLLIFIGSLIGFLIFNWHPSRIYMGDSGSQFLGITLAIFSISILWNERNIDGGLFQINQFLLPFFVFTIPIFDTLTVFIHRLLRKQSPFVGGKDHLSHHIVYLGFKDNIAVSILAGINLIYIFTALIIMWKYKNTPNIFLYLFSFWILTFIIIQLFYIKAKKSLDNKIESSSF